VPPSYPLTLDVAGRRVVVVGGGPVAARRARSLVTAKAEVYVVAPALCEDLSDLAEEGRVSWQARDYLTGDLVGAWLVHTATGDRVTDDLVAADAEADHVWCVRADDAARSAAWTPAVTRAGEVTVAVTAGGDPRRATTLRDAIALALDTGELPLRPHRPATTGSVALVGGGPGDPGLITTRGRRLLAEADIVLVDRLAPRALLDELDPSVVVIDVGKTAGHHPLPQDEINRLLVEHALGGQRVVRLKGGDPFMLGRGGEEALACLAAGVPLEVVPGVTSAVAVPAAAGIPVTHRGLARQVTIASGHEGLDWAALARLDGTLVLLMGVSTLGAATAALIQHGKPAGTPAAVIESGFTDRQRTTTGTLATIADLARERAVQPPAVVVIGDVVDLHAALG
jgi:uroporphyrin-III C-methyltransferase/precorrin-2 dehydrogenase/sirohydrochlorin ferrochelatase